MDIAKTVHHTEAQQMNESFWPTERRENRRGMHCIAHRLAWIWLAGLSLNCTALLGADWPQWGGDGDRNMYAPEKGLPVQLDAGKLKPDSDEVDLATTKKLKWVAKLGGQSYGNVTVAGGKVFVGTNNESPRDRQHEGDRGILMCFDEKSGAFLWQLVIPKLAAGMINDYDQVGQLSSATVEGNRVYIVTSRCEVMCLDANGFADGNDGPYTNEPNYMVQDVRVKGTQQPAPPAKLGTNDADIIWVYDMMHELGAFPHNAANGSVLILGDVAYASTSNGQDWTHNNVPSPFCPSVIALHKKTGKLLAGDDAGIGPRVFHGQWSSPSTGMVEGRPLVFYGAGDGWCYAFDAIPSKQESESVLKTVWKFDCNPPDYRMKDGKPIKYGAAEGPNEVNATPVFFKERIYVSIGQAEAGDGVGRLVCIDAKKKGDITQSGLIWEFKQIHRSLSTVSIDPATGLLFIADFAGYVYCLDAETGKLYWNHDMKAAVWGSTLVADNKVYIGDEDGDLAIFAVSKEKKLLSELVVDGRKQDGPNFGAALYGTPVAANGVLYIQTHTHLYAFKE